MVENKVFEVKAAVEHNAIHCDVITVDLTRP